MKVIMFGWELPPYISGGLGTACKGIAEGLSSENIDITFVIPALHGKTAGIDSRIRILSAENYLQTFNFENDNTYSLSPYYTNNQSYSDFENTDLTGSILNFTGNYGRDLLQEVKKYSLAGKLIGRQEDFDIIHSHDWMTFPAGISAAEASGKPLIVHVHATEYDRSGSSPNMKIMMIEKEGFDRADRIIAVSYFTKNLIIYKYGIDPDKIDVVHNAVNRDLLIDRYQITRPLKEKIVLFLGRITSQKGPEYFIDAAVKVLNRLNNVRFVMGGNGDLLPKMIKKMAELQIADKFHFTGFLKGSEVEKIYAMSDLYIMPSVSEPFGLTPFEALLYDVPIIISKQAGAAEILEHAVKIDFWDTDKLADAIVLMLENNELRKKAVSDCLEDMKNMCWLNAAKKIIVIYNKTAQTLY